MRDVVVCALHIEDISVSFTNFVLPVGRKSSVCVVIP